jgi:5,10-methylene-tetrahydrofolate dehydrogenase/methenyl tetrahydrofolate cyclohydrolase
MAIETREFDCKAVAERFLDWVRLKNAALPVSPRLAAILSAARSDPGSLKYRDRILSDAQRLGIQTLSRQANSEAELLSQMTELNRDDSVAGMIVFYPIGGRIPDEDLMDLVSPHKDVEGLHSLNLGYLIKYKRFLDESTGIKCVVPATAKAVVKVLQEHAIPIERRFVTILNNSMRVGKPLGLMLENLNATVVNCSDKTRSEDMEACVRKSDIVVTAVPDPRFTLAAEWIKPGAAVLDVSFQGNIDPAALRGRASFMTAPGNGLGQVTRAMIFVNLIYCAQGVRS